MLTTKELIYYNDINGCLEIDNSCMESMQQHFTSLRKSFENDDSKPISSCNNISVSNTFGISSTQQGSMLEDTLLSNKTRIFSDDVNVREWSENRYDDNDDEVNQNVNKVATAVLPSLTDAKQKKG